MSAGEDLCRELGLRPPSHWPAVNAPAWLAQFQQAEQRQVDPLLAFVVRAEARALLWQAGELDLHKDAKVGQDYVQEIMAAAFCKVRR